MTGLNKVYDMVNARVMAIVLAGAVVIGFGIWGYNWHRARQEQKAHIAFADCIHEYELAYAGQEPWSKVESLCKAAYENNSNSHLAAYFLALQSDALLHQEKPEEARLVFKTVMDTLSSSSPLYAVYATKYALLCLDAPQADVQQSGLLALEKIAYNTSLAARDEAMYYLGLYYMTHDQSDKAQTVWNDLVAMLNDGQMVGSPWAALAQAKLQYMA